MIWKLWNLKPWRWLHPAAAARTDGHTARRGSAVWAAAARWRQSLSFGYLSFPTPCLENWTRGLNENEIFLWYFSGGRWVHRFDLGARGADQVGTGTSLLQCGLSPYSAHHRNYRAQQEPDAAVAKSFCWFLPHRASHARAARLQELFVINICCKWNTLIKHRETV